ncbi:MAG: dihydrofolate reductase family protein [Chitinophagaceae bacterium]|nr:dihydrofolate reductase family protein [Chitinophagaceae bacterium]
MGKLIYFMHVSLDGFVADPNGGMGWIQINDEIFDYVGSRVETTDTALYGRVTFEMMEAYWPTAAEKPGASKHDIDHSRWYAKAKKVVLSRSWQGKELPHTQIISNDLKNEISKLKASTQHDILLFGSPSAAHSLLAEGLIDGYWLFINPILLGKGIPLFKNITGITKLKLISTKLFASGVISLSYEKE